LNAAVKIAEAARALQKDPATLRRWVQRGCPTVNGPGAAGRGHGTEFDLDAVRRWKAGNLGHLDDAEQLQRLAVGLWDCLRRDEVHRLVGISERQAAEVLALVYERMHKNLTQQPLGDLSALPEEMKRLCAVFVR
jgi:hypothetical protein